MTTELRDAAGAYVTIQRGTSHKLVFNVLEPDGATPKNLVGATEICFAISESKFSTTRDILLSLSAGITHTGIDGVVTALFTPLQTESLVPGTRWCEFWIVDFVGFKDMPGKGPCIVSETTINLT